MSYLVVIPARLKSTRLPEKVLADIGGKPMIQHVWELAGRAAAARVLIATDSERVQSVAGGFGAECLLTRSNHASGSDRIAEVAERLKLDADTVIVNLQGDEPEMPPACLDQVARLLETGGDVATLCARIDDPTELEDPNAVKVVRDGQGRALYFSRSLIPHPRGRSPEAALADTVPFYRHLGLYAYRVEALRRFTASPPSELEQAEGLEQLRFLDLGLTIRIEEAVASIPPGIDGPEDLGRVRLRLG
ncbi:MAG: 3-deoxy-manno-octulosonate cytidylyltransferase [Xanthomonadales bacterium]|jgi:3-deoxy-manno-octulosonate cytidylyltransferase (CMP-KDO synthetase)|nr:3-deoxy-manno-octulosonate cytidylyltransferase [Xanthomonadales bacterium]